MRLPHRFLAIMALLSATERLLTELASPAIMRRVVASVDPLHPPADFNPARLLVMVGGGKGSGKSTLKELVAGALEENGVKRQYIAEFGSGILDDLFALPGVGALRPLFDVRAKAVATGSQQSAFTRISGELFARGRELAYSQHSPIIIDYHMDDPEVVRRLVRQAKDNGYETMFASVSVSPETALQRIAARQARTGRHTDVGTALKTHQAFATELPGYHGLFDVGLVFDNNEHYLRLIAKSVGGKVTVIDGEAYEQATAIAKGTRQAGGVAGGQAHGHHAGTMAEGHAAGADAGRASGGQRSFAERIADALQNRQPPFIL